MKVDAVLTWELDKAGAKARELEQMGYAGLKSVETAHDPFLPLLMAAQTTETIDLMTGIAVAFARSPMTLANTAHDLNAAAKGRLTVGLGSQIRPHIMKRYSMPWSSPAARMREFIMALRAIWANWYEGVPLEFLGKFYTHTLMTPFFTPTNSEYGPPKVYLAAVGPLMTEVAGKVVSPNRAASVKTSRSSTRFSPSPDGMRRKKKPRKRKCASRLRSTVQPRLTRACWIRSTLETCNQS